MIRASLCVECVWCVCVCASCTCVRVCVCVHHACVHVCARVMDSHFILEYNDTTLSSLRPTTHIPSHPAHSQSMKVISG